MAEAFFNKLAKNHHAISAGTHVLERAGSHLHQFVVEAMHEAGLDLSLKTTQQLTKELYDSADHVVVLTDPENLPDYAHKDKATHWNVEDRSGHDLESHHRMRDEILQLVEKYVGEIKD